MQRLQLGGRFRHHRSCGAPGNTRLVVERGNRCEGTLRVTTAVSCGEPNVGHGHLPTSREGSIRCRRPRVVKHGVLFVASRVHLGDAIAAGPSVATDEPHLETGHATVTVLRQLLPVAGRERRAIVSVVCHEVHGSVGKDDAVVLAMTCRAVHKRKRLRVAQVSPRIDVIVGDPPRLKRLDPRLHVVVRGRCHAAHEHAHSDLALSMSESCHEHHTHNHSPRHGGAHCRICRVWAHQQSPVDCPKPITHTEAVGRQSSSR